jgi:hypothetical protein
MGGEEMGMQDMERSQVSAGALPSDAAKSASPADSYNLLDEQWIPVLYSDGRFERVGIVRALREAGTIRQIAASNPMDRVALLRFLLAVLLWCKPDLSDADRAGLNGGNGIPEEWLKKLQDNRAAFNLLGDGERFNQDPTVKSQGTRPIADLLVEFPGADSVNHMRHVLHGSYGFCPACCALGILRLSVWAPANRYYPASVNPGSAAYAITEGRNLLLTLVANLPKATTHARNAPWLSNTPPDSPGAVDYLAWRPRRLWLNEEGSDNCAYCGRPGPLIKRVCIAKGWPTPSTTGQQFSKQVLTEFQKLNPEYKQKATDRRKWADKVVKVAPVIRRCRMSLLAQMDSKREQAPPDESDAAKIARVCNQLYAARNSPDCKNLITKATQKEQPTLKEEDTRVKKFWGDDPFLLKESEPIGLPDLNADVGEHTSRFWRDGVRLGGGREVAIGIVGDGQYIFHDAPAVRLPDADGARLACLTKRCAEVLRGMNAEKTLKEDGEPKLKRCGLLKQVTPNPDRQHPEINAAVVHLTPDTEAKIRAKLNDPGATTDDTQFLDGVYEPLVEQVVASTIRGSPLRRRAAMQAARDLLGKTIAGLTDNSSSAPAGSGETAPAKSKRRGKKKPEGS